MTRSRRQFGATAASAGTRGLLLVLLGLLLGLGSVRAQAPPAGEPTGPAELAEEIDRLVTQLGDPSYTVRRRASDRLWHIGAAAGPPLERARLESEDAEVVFRATHLLRRIRYGILPDTPPETVALIQTFIGGGAPVKQAILDQLINRGEMDLTLRLIQAESNVEVSSRLSLYLMTKAEKIVPELLLGGKLDEAENLLRLAARSRHGAANLAVFLFLREKADAEIARLIVEAKTDSDRLLLAWLLKVSGRPGEALAVAEQVPDEPVLVISLMAATENWERIGRITDRMLPDTHDQTGRVELLLVRALCFRLADNDAEVDASCRQLDAIGATRTLEPQTVRRVINALSAIGEIERAMAWIDYCAPWNQEFIAVRLLSAQGRYTQALQRIGIEDTSVAAISRLDLGIDPTKRTATDRSESLHEESLVDRNPYTMRFQVLLQASRILERLGQRDSAQALCLRLLDEYDSEFVPKGIRSSTYRELDRLGARNEIIARFDTDEKLSDLDQREALFSALFGSKYQGAQLLFLLRRHDGEGSSLRASFEYALEHAGPKPTKPIEMATIAGWLHQAERFTQFPNERGPASDKEFYGQLAWICEWHGYQAYVEHCQERSGSTGIARLSESANAAARKREWSDASRFYFEAWIAGDRKLSQFLYCYGYCLKQQGAEAEGEKTMRAARMLAMADPTAQESLASTMDWLDPGSTHLDQWRLAGRVDPGVYAGAIGPTMFAALARDSLWASVQEKLDATDLAGRTSCRAMTVFKGALGGYSDRILAAGIPPTIELTRIRDYHVARAKMLLADGKTGEAVVELRRATSVLPGQTDVVLDMLPKLEAAGLVLPGHELFDSAFAVLDRRANRYSDNTIDRRDLALMCAKTGRQLDDALARATEAVDLDPASAENLDALAEVHFARGERENAIECAEQCRRLQPENEYYQRQLKRFSQVQ